jgi:hypothetical protein
VVVGQRVTPAGIHPDARKPRPKKTWVRRSGGELSSPTSKITRRRDRRKPGEALLVVESHRQRRCARRSR